MIRTCGALRCGTANFSVCRCVNVFHNIERHGGVACFTLSDLEGNLAMICQEEA